MLGDPLLQGMHGTRALLALCSGDMPSEAEMRRAESLAKDALAGGCEVAAHVWRDPRMGGDCYATLLLGE
ncbi:MAG: hypothetical protein Q8Q28_09965 [Pseudomonadota bacterium]|nr:hypothetical protein [Pseudomonadota bacterium]